MPHASLVPRGDETIVDQDLFLVSAISQIEEKFLLALKRVILSVLFHMLQSAELKNGHVRRVCLRLPTAGVCV